MKIFLDANALRQLVLVSAFEYKDKRRYYIAKNRLVILVARNNIQLGVQSVGVADCSIGWDDGWQGFVKWVGYRHTKVTVWRMLLETEKKYPTLSSILAKAPVPPKPEL